METKMSRIQIARHRDPPHGQSISRSAVLWANELLKIKKVLAVSTQACFVLGCHIYVIKVKLEWDNGNGERAANESKSFVPKCIFSFHSVSTMIGDSLN